MAQWAESIIQARYLVGSPGEDAATPWWGTSVTSPVGRRMLARLFPRTVLSASLETVSRAAAIVHDQQIGRLGAYDGVIINAAPLHRLFRVPKWAKDTKECWNRLERGDYDWAHLAYTIWPDRVHEKCRTDKSLAIAHVLEELYVEPVGAAAKKRRGRARSTVATPDTEADGDK